jgi:hypothetical protein
MIEIWKDIRGRRIDPGAFLQAELIERAQPRRRVSLGSTCRCSALLERKRKGRRRRNVRPATRRRKAETASASPLYYKQCMPFWCPLYITTSMNTKKRRTITTQQLEARSRDMHPLLRPFGLFAAYLNQTHAILDVFQSGMGVLRSETLDGICDGLICAYRHRHVDGDDNVTIDRLLIFACKLNNSLRKHFVKERGVRPNIIFVWCVIAI